MSKIDYGELAGLIEKCGSAVILTHKSPDGDCIGAGLALCYYLRSKGKKANVLNSDGIPKRYDFLAQGYSDEEFEPEYVISVDLADTQLLGEPLEKYKDRVDLCIDHHKSNKLYAKRSFVDGDACAACLMLYELFGFMGELDGAREPIASCLYLSLIHI